MRKICYGALITLYLGASMLWAVPANAEPTRPIVFPVLGYSTYSNDFTAPRGSSLHLATDIIAGKHFPLVAAVDGTITYVTYPEPSWGYSVGIRDSEGYEYNYLHMNNDKPGTNNNQGGPMRAYAPDMRPGNKVVRGQLLGWVGDSGRANGVSHLHFEMEDFNGNKMNPYFSLNQATRIGSPVIPPQMSNEILPYGHAYIGLNIAAGNLDWDEDSEIVTGAGAGGGPHVKVYDDNKAFSGFQFMAYDPRFNGGVDVATGDVDGDGKDEIITGAGRSGGPHVRIFRLDGTLIGEFMAYHPSFTGGIKVAAGDVDGDGNDEIIASPGPTGGPAVRVFELNGTLTASFYAYGSSFTGGIDVASGDVSGSSADEIIASPGPTGGPAVRVFELAGSEPTMKAAFLAYDAAYAGGVRVSVGNVRESSNKEEIVTVPASPPGGPSMKMFDGSGGFLQSKVYLESWWEVYGDVAAGHDNSYASASVNRRATVRDGID